VVPGGESHGGLAEVFFEREDTQQPGYIEPTYP
jgi:hypothetical protein